MRDAVELRNLTLHLDQIGINLRNESDVTDVFGMLMRLEFDDFSGHMSGKIMCDLYLDIERLEKRLSGFATYDIMFLKKIPLTGYQILRRKCIWWMRLLTKMRCLIL